MPTNPQKRRRRGYRLPTPKEQARPVRPTWIRVDEAPDFVGISRATLYVWLETGKIESKHISVRPGSSRTIRLINFDSLNAYINALPSVEPRLVGKAAKAA